MVAWNVLSRVFAGATAMETSPIADVSWLYAPGTERKQKRPANDYVESEFHPNGVILVAPRAYWKGYLKLSLQRSGSDGSAAPKRWRGKRWRGAAQISVPQQNASAHRQKVWAYGRATSKGVLDGQDQRRERENRAARNQRALEEARSIRSSSQQGQPK